MLEVLQQFSYGMGDTGSDVGAAINILDGKVKNTVVLEKEFEEEKDKSLPALPRWLRSTESVCVVGGRLLSSRARAQAQ